MAGAPGVGGRADGTQGLIRAFDLVKVTASSYIVQTLQEMVTLGPKLSWWSPG